MILYQFPISHYCEKVRWTLDWKGMDYDLVNLMPGPHIAVTKKLADKTTVPLLVNGETVIQDSTHIIDYLDSIAPQKTVTPKDPGQSLEALEWEEYLDEKVGPHLRRYFYFYILPRTGLAKKLLLHQAPAWAHGFYFFLFPLVRALMKKGMNISAKSAERSKHVLSEALEKLNKRITRSQSGYLVGDDFSRADLTAASLLAPLCLPAESPFPWPDQGLWPQELLDYQDSVREQPFFKWVLDLYKNHRKN